MSLCATAHSDESSIRTGTLSQATLLKMQAEAGLHGLAVPPPKTSIRLYKIRYGSVDVHGEPCTLSGLLILPKAAPKGLLLYYHGTIRDRDAAPSRYNGTNKSPEAEYVTMAFASGGYAVIMPDGLGLGDSPGVHPYPDGEVNAHSGIDLIGPARKFAKRSGVSIAKQLYVAGYSEGGAIAMCTVRELERSHTFTPQMAAPMSGPYDLSGTTVTSLLEGKQGPEDLATKLYLLSYAAYSASVNLPGIDLKDYFAPSFATYIPFLFEKNLDDVGLAKKLLVKALQLGAINSIDKVLTKRFRDSIRWADATNPILAEMMRSNCYDWVPRTKMLLPYLKGDDVVVEANTLKTIDTMRLRGVGRDQVQPFEITGPKLSHGTAVPAALSAARRFFDGGFAALVTRPRVAKNPSPTRLSKPHPVGR